MNSQEFNQIIAYLADPNRNTWIEAELPITSRSRFESIYRGLTNNYPLPDNSEHAPLFVWPDGTNKWSIQLRLYFTSDKNIPNSLDQMCTNNNRHGYEKYDKRINNTNFIYELLERGFILGAQNVERIH